MLITTEECCNSPRQNLRPSIPVFLLLLTSMLLTACASTGDGNGFSNDSRRRLYVDANLAFSLAVPENWQRSMMTTPSRSPAPYAVQWREPELTRKEAAVILVTALPHELNGNTSDALLDYYRNAFPTFTSTAVSTEEVARQTLISVLGFTPRNNRQLLFSATNRQLLLLEFRAPAERFGELQPLFDTIQESLVPTKRP